jgi:hypothetical protein
MVRSRLALLPVLLLLAALLTAQSTARAAEPGDNAVLRWDDAVLDAIRVTRTGPTVAARALAIAHTAMYDAWTAYDAVANPTRRSAVVRRPAAERTAANKTQAVSHAAHKAAADLFPSQRAAFDSLLVALGYQPSASTDLSTPAGIGNMAAQAVLDFRHRDGANQLGDLSPGAYADYTGYAPRNQATTPLERVDLRYWQPLIVNGVEQRFLTPHWGRVTPFSLSSGSQFRPPAPPSYREDVLRTQVAQLISISANLTDEQKVIVEFWRNGFNNETQPASGRSWPNGCQGATRTPWTRM